MPYEIMGIASVGSPRIRTIYCQYTVREFLERAASSEYIIPLTLGGASNFKVPVDASFSSKVSIEIDRAFANEVICALDRSKCDARGHSGKAPIATVRNANYGNENRKAQVQFHYKHGITELEVEHRQNKTGIGSFRMNTSLNIDLPIRFAAKVALTAEHFVSCDLFHQYVDRGQLRDVMNIDPAQLGLNMGPQNLVSII